MLNVSSRFTMLNRVRPSMPVVPHLLCPSPFALMTLPSLASNVRSWFQRSIWPRGAHVEGRARSVVSDTHGDGGGSGAGGEAARHAPC